MIILFLMNIAVLGTSFLLVRRYIASENQSYRLLALFSFFYVQVILIQLFWGIIGRLYLANVIFLSLAIFIVTCLILLKGKSNAKNLFGFPSEVFTNKIALFCLSAILGFGLVKVIINLVNPPFGWDSLNYHFTFPVEWIKHGNLINPITINDDLGPSYYPINGSLIYLWFILPLKNVFLADLGQIPFFLISFLALYGLCRKLGTGKEYSFYAASLFTLTPNYFKQMEIAYVDVMVCAWFLLSLYFLFSFYAQGRSKDAIFFSLGLGMLIGTKTIALPYGGVLFVLFVIILLKNYRLIGWHKIILYFSLAVFITLFLGGYGYIRNLCQTGNPLYPLNAQCLGRNIFKGVFDKTFYTSHVCASDYAISKILFHEGMGAGMIVFLIPGFFLFTLGIFRKRINVDKFIIFLIPTGLYLIWRYLIPLANLRYLYPALAIAYVVPFSIFSSKKNVKTIISTLVVLCCLASIFEISTRVESISSILLSAVIFFGFKHIYMLLSNLRMRHWMLIFTLAIFSLYILNIDYNKNEYKRYVAMVKYSGFWPDAAKAWVWLNENTSGQNIAYVGRPVPFPLYGTNFKNNVFYVSVNETDPAMVHYFQNSHYSWGSDFMELHKSLEEEGNYRQHPNFDIWLANLERRKVDYLFVYSLHQTKTIVFPLEDIWAKANPDKFVVSFMNPTVHIYKIK